MGVECMSCCRSEQEKLKQQNAQLKAQLAELQGQSRRGNRVHAQVDKLSSQEADLQKKVSFLEKQIAEKDGQIDILTKKLQEKEQQIHIRQGSSFNNEQELRKLKSQLNEAERNRARLDQEKYQFQQQLQQKRSQIEGLKRQIQSMKVYVQRANFQLEQQKLNLNRRENQNTMGQKRQLDALLLQKQNLIQSHKQNLASFQNSLNTAEAEVRRLKGVETELNRLKAAPKTSMPSYAQSNDTSLKGFFWGDAMDDDDDDFREYLLRILEKKLQRKIKGTRLVYRYDPLSKVNIHKYIDEKENLVFIFKLNNGFVVAAWHEGVFRPRTPSNGEGLIFSLPNKRVFQLVNPRSKAVAYDDYHVIFGNAQLRLKTNDNKIFSNFGVNNGYYRSRGESVDILFGEGDKKREMEMSTYQVFQLKF